MMIRLVFGLFMAISMAGAGNAQQNLDVAAKPEALSPADVRFLQGMLAVDGSYAGRLTGQWDAASQKALDQYTATRFDPAPLNWRILAVVSRQFEATLAGGRWVSYFDEPSGMSYLLPLSLMVRQPANQETLWVDTQSELVIRTRLASPQAAQERHEWIRQNSILNDQSILLRYERQMITGGLFKDRVNTAYMRSFKRGGQYASTMVQWRPQKAAVARLIIASLVLGQQDALELGGNGRLRKAINALMAEEGGQVAVSEPDEPARPPRRDGLVGTGFYVNNTDLVTASAVFENCKAVRLGDGTKLRKLGMNAVQGLALATSPARSQHWLAVDPQVQAEPGQALATAGIAQRDGGFRGVAQSRGKVQGETLEGNNGLRIVASLRRRLGNDGAPVFDQANRVVGVVVAGPGEYRSATSPITPVRQLVAMMQRNRVLFASRGGQNPDSDPAQAIVALFCQ